MDNTEDTDQPQADQRPNVQIAQDVNSYLNRYVNIADAKAAALLATDLAVGSSALRMSSEQSSTNLVNGLAIAAITFSLLAAGAVLFPRLPKGSRGLIFWEDIREYNSLSSYSEEFRTSTDEELAAQYVSQNWHISRVLNSKHTLLRWSTGLFLIGVLLHATAYLA